MNSTAAIPWCVAPRNARVKTSLLRLEELDLEALQIKRRLGLALSQITQLRNRAVRLQAEQADLEKLFLIRMIGSGEYNLENYLIELQNAFFDFEEQFGLPDNRQEIISLRDDILRIPTKDDSGITLTQSQRDQLLQERFNGVKATQNTTTYRNGRLRGRPLVNTHWELIINQRDESVNMDIDLQSLTDIKIYVYYTDFTVF